VDKERKGFLYIKQKRDKIKTIEERTQERAFFWLVFVVKRRERRNVGQVIDCITCLVLPSCELPPVL
jgi:hypothetical protein